VLAFDNENYFVTWTQLTDFTMRGRFFNNPAFPIDTSFVVISTSENKMPSVDRVWRQFIFSRWNKVDSNFSMEMLARFISPLVNRIDNDTRLAPD